MKMPIRVTLRPTVHLLLLLQAMLLLIPLATSDCPSLCECKWKNGKESVRCHNANLTEIPPRLDAGTQVLDLQRNEIVRLDGDEFSAVNLLNLQKIFLIDCQLTHLHRFAFRNLINLVELDLSENRLSAVPSHLFDSMAELRELRLSGNPVLRLDNAAFDGLTHLVRLELSNCHIRRIDLGAFEGVRQSLEWLKLDGNELINVQPAALTILNNLHGIELTRNNWNCTCTLRPLREWMLRRNIPYEVTPVCAQPERLKGRPWSRMDVDEFACPPTLVAFSSGGGAASGTVTVKAIEGQNVTIGCGIVAGNPDPTIRWMFRNRVIVGNVSLRSTSSASSAPSASSSSVGPPDTMGNGQRSSSSVAAITTLDTRKKFYHHLGRTATNVTIAWIDSPDSGVYKCIAENGAGRSEAIISVLVYSRHYLIDRNNNVIEASVALSHSSSRFIFIISTVVAVLFVVLSMLLAICYYTVHKKNVRAAAVHRHHGQLGGSEAANGLGLKKKVLNKKSFSFLLCQKDRSESYEKIEMLTRTNPVTAATRTDRGGVDETSCKIYCDRMVGEDEYLEDEDDDTMGLAAAGKEKFPVSASPQSIQDRRRRSMSLNLSNSPTTANRQQQKRKKASAAAAVKLSSRRRNGDYYSNVPTTADEEQDSAGGGAGGHREKLMADEMSELFTKHQAQGDNPPSDAETQHQNQWLNGRFLPPPGERGIASQSAVNVHHQQQQQQIKKVTSAGPGINLSRSNFSHPLADLGPTSSAATCTSTEPLINIGSTSELSDNSDRFKLSSSEEVIRHHVMRKRILNNPMFPPSSTDPTSGIVIYTTAKAAGHAEAPESFTATPTIIGEFDEDRSDDKLGRLSPTLNSIMRNDENFDLFDVKSNLDDFYVKQLNYDYHQLQQQHQLLLQSHHQHQLLTGGTGGGSTRTQKNYFCSLPRKRSSYESKNMGFGAAAPLHGGCAEDLFDAPLEDSLFRNCSAQRQKSSSELDLMTSFETSSPCSTNNNGLSFITVSSGGGFGGAATPDDTEDNNGRIEGRQGTIIRPLGCGVGGDNNKATPLLNFPLTTTLPKVTGPGNGSGMALGLSTGSGIFPGNCGSPSITMGGGVAAGAGGVGVTPLAPSILSPTTVSAASSSSPSSSASSSAKRAANGKGNAGGDYDYHAAQLEMFLDEYKRLQQQLCKMKETCDSIRRTEQLYGGVAGSTGTGQRNKAVMPSSISSTLSGIVGSESMSLGGGGAGHQYYPMNSKLMEKSNVLLPGTGPVKGLLPKSLSLGNKHKSYAGGQAPEPPPYWLHRNELLKGIQSQQQIFSTGTSGLGTNHPLLQRKTTTTGSGGSSSSGTKPDSGTAESSSGGSS